MQDVFLQLANDFGQVWNAEATTSEDRKRLLGKLIEDVTLIRNDYQVTVKLRLRGGRTQELPPVDLPRHRADIMRRDASPEVLAELETLLEAGLYDQAAAEELNRQRHRDSRGDPFTDRTIQTIRRRYHMKNGLRRQKEKLKNQGYKFGYELAAELGICYETLRRSAEQDPEIKVHRIPAGKRTLAQAGKCDLLDPGFRRCRRDQEKMEAAYAADIYDQAKGQLQTLMQTLEARCPKAATSLREGLEETLTLHKLGVAKLLRDRLRTTNMIESINGGLAYTTRRVTRWCNSNQRQRWIAAACLDIEENSLKAIPQDWQWEGLLRALKRHSQTKKYYLITPKASGKSTNNGASPPHQGWMSLSIKPFNLLNPPS